jgi:hypothetical protein
MDGLMTGWMWLPDKNASGSLEDVFSEARLAFQRKFGYAPNCCEVDLGIVKNECVIAGMRIVPKKGISRNYFFMGKVN